jgi:hypothetical protein
VKGQGPDLQLGYAIKPVSIFLYILLYLNIMILAIFSLRRKNSDIGVNGEMGGMSGFV